jgi:hypothetical protein
MPHAFNTLIVEVYVSDFDVRRKRFGPHGEAVIVGSDFYSRTLYLFNRLIPTTMAEYKLEG